MKRPALYLLLFFACDVQISAQSSDPARMVEPANKSENVAEIEKERTPQIDRLYKLVRSADRITVVVGSDAEEKVLYESKNASDLNEFFSALKLDIPEGWTMSICPDPRVVLYKDGKEIGWVANVMGREVITSVWQGNAPLANPGKWIEWFDKRGMPQVRKERDDAEADARKYELDEQRWYAAMPRGIKEPFEKQKSFFGLPSMGDTRGFVPILLREYPDKNLRILALLHWYGSGAGPWSGHPSYESIAEDILFEFTTKEILEALYSRDLSTTEVEGAARLFAGWGYYKKRPDDFKLIPKELTKRFLDHAMKSSDGDKRQRAKSAFENKN